MAQFHERNIMQACGYDLYPKLPTSLGALRQPQRCKAWSSSGHLVDFMRGLEGQRKPQRGVTGTKTHAGPIQTASTLFRQKSQPWIIPDIRRNLEYFREVAQSVGPGSGALLLKSKGHTDHGISNISLMSCKHSGPKRNKHILFICDAKSLANEQLRTSIGNTEQKLRLDLGTV